MRLLLIVSIALAFPASVRSQQTADPDSTGFTIVYPAGCPVFVGGVVAGSPGDRAGMRGGDRLLAVNGTPVIDGPQAGRLLWPGSPAGVTLTLLRDGKEIEVIAGREKQSTILARVGQRAVSGVIVPNDTTQAEVDRMLSFDGQRYVARVFPTHYPADPELYYAGFEIFLLRDPTQAAVGGIEQGPAAKAGVHWGDVILAANDVPVAGKTPAELEQMFSAPKPMPMRLKIDRLGTVRTFEFRLEKASDVARQSGRRLVDGHLVPSGIADTDVHCFLK